MNYAEAMSFIKNTEKFGSRPGLERISRLLELLSNPQNDIKTIHIAGTNAKGSVAAFTSSILMSCGYKTGLFTSPFIYEFNERIQINRKNISNDELTQVLKTVKTAVGLMLAEGAEHPTEFELITAAAFLYFKQQLVDFAVIEVGLGGRFDATNVIENPLVSVITKIGLDHTEYLGNTYEKIAFEKCGIIKNDSVCVTYPKQHKEALKIISENAASKNSRLVIPSGEANILRCDESGSDFEYENNRYSINLIGVHQIYNAITAICAAKQLNGFNISNKSIEEGLYSAQWKGRMELVMSKPPFILDGAHNSDGIEALTETISQIFNGKRIICIMGMLKDKDYEKCLELLSNSVNDFIFTKVNNPRALEPEILYRLADKSKVSATVRTDNSEAVRLALDMADENSVIFAIGSLYMLSNIKNSI